jgi:hypothetical protein
MVKQSGQLERKVTGNNASCQRQCFGAPSPGTQPEQAPRDGKSPEPSLLQHSPAARCARPASTRDRCCAEPRASSRERWRREQRSAVGGQMRLDVRREVQRLATPKVKKLVECQSMCLGRKSYEASSEVSYDFRWNSILSCLSFSSA